MFTTDWFVDALKHVILAALVAGATTFVAAPALDVDTAKGVYAAGLAAAIAAVKSIVAAWANDGSAQLVRLRVPAEPSSAAA